LIGINPNPEKVLVLIDGEHYPDVTSAALRELEQKGNEIVGIVFLGGAEKLAEPSLFSYRDVPFFYGGSSVSLLREALEKCNASMVIDLSDEPVTGYFERFRLISEALARGVSYRGADFLFLAPLRPFICDKPTIGIWGSGKRVGKTAISSYFARSLSERGSKPCILTMGRGGPEEPEVLSRPADVTDEYLLGLVAKGRHAASDHFEDAMTARVMSIGCRRCGGGMAGEPFYSNVREGAILACQQDCDLVLLEGSGAAIPPVGADSKALVVSALQPEEYLLSYLGPYRLLLSDLILVTMCEEFQVSSRKLQRLRDGILSINPEASVIEVVFRPRPLGDIDGKTAFLVTTASKDAAQVQAEHLERFYGARIIGFSSNLADRARLARDIKESPRAQVLLTELKAAGVDTVSLFAKKEKKELIYIENVPFVRKGNLEEEIERLERLARMRFLARQEGKGSK